jgi:hypothetical protein
MFSAGAWGISRNFPFTNLLVRHPSNEDRGWYKVDEYKDGNENNTASSNLIYHYWRKSPGNKYTVKLDVPVGIGGLQGIFLVHDDFFEPDNYQTELFGVGGKYNIALRWADIDAGFFYQKIMPFRAFVSVKTTIKDTELYGEALLAFPYGERDNTVFSGTIGVVQDFFADKLRLNGEIFYNGEKGATWTKSADPTRGLAAETYPLIEGLNLALNLEYKLGGWGGFRFFVQTYYAVLEDSAQLAAGFRFTPFPRVTISAALPMALGSRDGTYYSHNADKLDRPFAIVLAATVSGNYKHTW